MINVQIIKKVNNKFYGYSKGGFTSKQDAVQYAQNQLQLDQMQYSDGYRATIVVNGKINGYVKCGRV